MNSLSNTDFLKVCSPPKRKHLSITIFKLVSHLTKTTPTSDEWSYVPEVWGKGGESKSEWERKSKEENKTKPCKYIIFSCSGNIEIKIKDTKMPLGEKYMKTFKKGYIMIYTAKASIKNLKKHLSPP